MLQTKTSVVLRKFAGRLEACFSSGGRIVGTPGPTASLLSTAFSVALFLLVPLLALLAIASWVNPQALHLALAPLAGVTLAFPALVTSRPLATILKELKALQEEHKGKAMPDDVAKKFEELATEAKALQDEADRDRQVKGFERFAAEVPDPALPSGSEPEQKHEQIAGYVSLGELFVNSDAFRAFKQANLPQNGSAPMQVVTSLGQKFVAMTRTQRKAFETALRETKSTPTTAARVIEPERLSEIVRASEHTALRLRDVINVSRTESNLIEYVRLNSYTRAAAPVADEGAKPEAAAAFDLQSAAVRTQAVWIPVTEQQLSDAPQLIDIVNGELTFDLDKLFEEQMTYGSGAGQNFPGLFKDAGVLAGRTVGGDTLLDKVRRAITDVRVAGYEPNAVLMHPVDWEGVVLLKGTDNRYLWVVVSGPEGDRIWNVPVVESIAAEDYTSANTTDERNVLIGDFLRGATLWDRQQTSVQVGWINDQFTKNMRTLRAEARAAFGIKRPKAFRKIQTVAPVA